MGVLIFRFNPYLTLTKKRVIMEINKKSSCQYALLECRKIGAFQQVFELKNSFFVVAVFSLIFKVFFSKKEYLFLL